MSTSVLKNIHLIFVKVFLPICSFAAPVLSKLFLNMLSWATMGRGVFGAGSGFHVGWRAVGAGEWGFGCHPWEAFC